MTILATIIAIAAWCGFPNQYQTPKDIQICREHIIDCLAAHLKDAKCFYNVYESGK